MKNPNIAIGDKITLQIRKSKYCNCSFGTNKNQNDIREITITIKDKQDLDILSNYVKSETFIKFIKHDKTESGS